MKIAVVGLTHLGVCMSIAAHEWGLDVLALDSELTRAAAIQKAEFDAAEPGVIDFLAVRSDRFIVASDIALASDVDLVLIAVDTTLDANGENDDREVITLLTAVAQHLPDSVPIVIASQVRPGFTRAHQAVHPQIYYFMETLIFGRGLERAQHPERYIIGSPDPELPLPPALQSFLELPGCPLFIMSYESAELTKLAANFMLSSSITAANSLADLAQRIGANWQQIESALRADARIGAKSYISAGLGIGGANLARDLHGIKEMADRTGADSSLAALMLDHSDYMRSWVLRCIVSLQQQMPIQHLAVLGLAYKPGTQSMRDGAGIDVVQTFETSMDIAVHDPAVELPQRPEGSRAHAVSDPQAALLESELVVLSTPWPQYSEVIREFLETSPTVVIIDPYRLVDPTWIRSEMSQVMQLGVSHV